MTVPGSGPLLDLDAIEAGLTTGAIDWLSPQTSLALIAQVRRAEAHAREMERQRNAFGDALTRAANGEQSTLDAAADAMLALSEETP